MGGIKGGIKGGKCIYQKSLKSIPILVKKGEDFITSPKIIF